MWALAYRRSDVLILRYFVCVRGEAKVCGRAFALLCCSRVRLQGVLDTTRKRLSLVFNYRRCFLQTSQFKLVGYVRTVQIHRSASYTTRETKACVRSASTQLTTQCTIPVLHESSSRLGGCVAPDARAPLLKARQHLVRTGCCRRCDVCTPT